MDKRQSFKEIQELLNSEVILVEDNTEEIEEIEELKRYEEGTTYTYKYSDVPEKINELVKAVNQLIIKLANTN